MPDKGTKDINTQSAGSEQASGKTLKTPGARQKKKTLTEEPARKPAATGHDLVVYSRKLLSLLAKEKEISQGIFYLVDNINNKDVLRVLSAYAYESTETGDRTFEVGEGFPGQVAKDGTLINIFDVPDGYISIVSGLGKADPASLIIFPVIHNEKVIAVIELASFHRFTEEDEIFFTKFSTTVAEKIAGYCKND